MTRTLCNVCEISDRDTMLPTTKWVQRHYRAGPKPPCKWARMCGRLYHAAYHDRSVERQRRSPTARDGWVTADSICDVCGITATSEPGDRWRRRHDLVGSPPCDAARLSRRLREADPVRRAKTVARNAALLRKYNEMREAGLMPAGAHGTYMGYNQWGCKCDECREVYNAVSKIHSRNRRKRQRADAQARRQLVETT